MDALGLSPPGELVFDGNVSDGWRQWRRRFENYLTAINLVAEPADENGVFPAGNTVIWRRQVAILLHTAGDEAYEIYSQFEFAEDEDENKLPDVLQKFEEHCNPRKSQLYEWFVFWSMNQSEDEPIDMYLKRLKTQASKCDFGDQKDMMLLCRVVFGSTDVKLKERLLRDNTMTLDRAIQEIRASQVTKSQLKHIATGDTIATLSSQSVKNESVPAAKYDSLAAKKLDCRYCGYEHVRGKCPAYGQTCKRCGGKNHFQKKCQSKKVNSIQTDTAVAEGVNNLFIGTIKKDQSGKKSWTESYKVSVANQTELVNFKVDTGAEANIITHAIVKRLGAQLEPTKSRLLGYDGSVIHYF